MRQEAKESAFQRIKDAEEFIESSGDDIIKGRFKAAVVGAGDAVIAANDAFTIFFIEEKASRDHSEAITIHKKAGMKINENKVMILKNLLDERHRHGYRAVQTSKNVAEKDVYQAKVFIKWVREKMIR